MRNQYTRRRLRQCPHAYDCGDRDERSVVIMWRVKSVVINDVDNHFNPGRAGDEDLEEK